MAISNLQHFERAWVRRAQIGLLVHSPGAMNRDFELALVRCDRLKGVRHIGTNRRPLVSVAENTGAAGSATPGDRALLDLDGVMSISSTSPKKFNCRATAGLTKATRFVAYMRPPVNAAGRL